MIMLIKISVKRHLNILPHKRFSNIKKLNNFILNHYDNKGLYSIYLEKNTEPGILLASFFLFNSSGEVKSVPHFCVIFWVINILSVSDKLFIKTYVP